MFYKQITDFIYKRQFIYQGPATEFDGYYATAAGERRRRAPRRRRVRFLAPLDFIPGLAARAWLRRELDAGLLASAARLQGHGDDRRDARQPGRPLRATAAPVEQPRQLRADVRLAPRVGARRVAVSGREHHSYGDGSADAERRQLVPSALAARCVGDASSFAIRRRRCSCSGLNLNNAVFGFYNGNSEAQFSGAARVLRTQPDHVGEVRVWRHSRDPLMRSHVLSAVAARPDDLPASGGCAQHRRSRTRSFRRCRRARRCRRKRRRQASRNSHSSRTATRAADTTASSCRPSTRSSSSRCSRTIKSGRTTADPIKFVVQSGDAIQDGSDRQAAQRQLRPADQPAHAGRRRSVLPLGRQSRRRKQQGFDEPAGASPA